MRFVVSAVCAVALLGCGETAEDPVGSSNGRAAGSSSTGGDSSQSTGDSESTGGDSSESTGGVDCRKQQGTWGPEADPAVRGTLIGANGTFTDECDAGGDLVEYLCSFHTLCGPNMTDCAPYPTGNVAPSNVDCGGTCQDGACNL